MHWNLQQTFLCTAFNLGGLAKILQQSITVVSPCDRKLGMSCVQPQPTWITSRFLANLKGNKKTQLSAWQLSAFCSRDGYFNWFIVTSISVTFFSWDTSAASVPCADAISILLFYIKANNFSRRRIWPLSKHCPSERFLPISHKLIFFSLVSDM